MSPINSRRIALVKFSVTKWNHRAPVKWGAATCREPHQFSLGTVVSGPVAGILIDSV